MGAGIITTELVRNVFKSRSLRASNNHVKSNMLEKRGWRAVRSYLCGDERNAEKDSTSAGSSQGAMIEQEFSSDVAVQDSCSILSSKPETRIGEVSSEFAEEDDSASVKNSEATVTQPILGETVDEGGSKNVKNEERIRMEKPKSTLELFQQEDAAIIIQSAFRNYLARRGCGEELKVDAVKQEDGLQSAIPSPDESFGTSVKVQIGDSTDASSFDLERENDYQPIQKRVRAQVLKLQEDWDDSTVSSSISRKRIQNRIEAATRRDRALAYAFAQRLRVCSKKKRTKCNSLDSNSSLSWLERWMATRESENMIFTEEHRKQSFKQKTKTMAKKLMDAVEEKESCGSNEVSLQVDDCFRPPKAKSKDKSCRPKMGPSSHCTKVKSTY